MSAPAARATAPTGSLLELVLEEQATLTAVERFARVHTPGEEGVYEHLMPSALPGAGEQYAFRVDLDACTGCKACVTACHSLNGLDEGETWRRVGLLVGEERERPVQRTVTGACHHCEDPGCLSGCPVKAYEKDPITGIVRHLDDQCIGCQYCTLTCPYDVPQYNARLGIVRKCDMCTGRLEEGEAPACVQGCPNGAISIAIVPARSPGSALLPTAAGALVDDAITRPPTRYVERGDGGGQRLLAPAERGLRAADADSLEPGPAHWPLAWLLVGTQLSVGLVSADLLGRAAGASAALSAGWLAVAWLAAVLGQAASITHVGRPWLMFRAVLGLRTSWMSREALALAVYLAALSAHAGLALLGALVPGWASAALPTTAIGAAAALLGWIAVFTQIMIYAVTGRPSWAPPRTAARFAGSVALLGAGIGGVIALAFGAPKAMSSALVTTAIAVGAAKIAGEWWVARRDATSPLAALVRSVRLEAGPLRRMVERRRAASMLGAVLLAAALGVATTGGAAPIAIGLALAGGVAWAFGEVMERHLFFVTEAARGMPGA